MYTWVGYLHDFQVVLGAQGSAVYDAMLWERQRGNNEFVCLSFLQ